MVQSPHRRMGGRTVPESPSWSVEEAARETGYHPEYIRRLCRDGKIESTKVGMAYLIKIESLRSYIANLDTSDGRTGPK